MHCKKLRVMHLKQTHQQVPEAHSGVIGARDEAACGANS